MTPSRYDHDNRLPPGKSCANCVHAATTCPITAEFLTSTVCVHSPSQYLGGDEYAREEMADFYQQDCQG